MTLLGPGQSPPQAILSVWSTLPSCGYLQPLAPPCHTRIKADLISPPPSSEQRKGRLVHPGIYSAQHSAGTQQGHGGARP